MTVPEPASITASGLTIGYHHEEILSGIDFAIAPGTMLALTGGNGSGKTTLLKTLAGLIKPLAGHVEVLGAAAGHSPLRVAYVGQHRKADNELGLRVVDVVRSGRYPARGLLHRLRDSDEHIVHESMRRIGIDPLADAPLARLSGGQRQRTFLAQALARCPDILLLDEPATGLDAGGRERYTDIVHEELAGGATVVVATHDFAEVESADLTMLLARRVVAFGPAEDVLTPENVFSAFGTSVTTISNGTFVHGPHHHD